MSDISRWEVKNVERKLYEPRKWANYDNMGTRAGLLQETAKNSS